VEAAAGRNSAPAGLHDCADEGGDRMTDEEIEAFGQLTADLQKRKHNK
jgi:hypothetical protein